VVLTPPRKFSNVIPPVNPILEPVNVLLNNFWDKNLSVNR